ncbi:MAG: hypothetical protein ACRC0X_01770 [Brevinema sp.]
MSLLLLLLLTIPLSFTFAQFNTLSIKGNVVVSDTNISGDFLYTLKNETTKGQKQWTFFIHPSVNILSVSHNNTQVRLDIQQGFNYRIITVDFDQEIPTQNRISLSIRFLINAQQNNPRFTITPNYVFLDARQFWFPYPIKDNDVDFELTVKTPLPLNSVMGGKKIAEVVIVDQKLSTWKNELKQLSPGASLIVTDSIQSSQNNINVYSENVKFQEVIYQNFQPFWETIQENHRFSPLSEIHIVPLDIVIPSHTNYEIEGEFLGNMFLVNNSIVDLINSEEQQYQSWNSQEEQLVEVLIHELYHSFFPGLAKHNSQEQPFMESLVQYLSWQLITMKDPEWGKKIAVRTRFYLQNLNIKNLYDYLWDFLLNISLLYNASEYARIDSITLTDTLIEKYRFIEYTRQDVFDTIKQHKLQTYLQKTAQSNNFVEEIDISKKTRDLFPLFQDLSIEHILYNSTLQAKKTNFEIVVTNETFFKRKKIVQLPVEASFISITHGYPFTWFGILSWVDNNNTKTIHLEIPQKEVWETNLIGNISLIQSISPLDIIEEKLSDNFISQQNIGRALISSLNTQKTSVDQRQIILSDLAKKKLSTFQNDEIKLVWDSTTQINENLWFINAFAVKDRQRVSLVSLPIRRNSDSYLIYNLLDQ